MRTKLSSAPGTALLLNRAQTAALLGISVVTVDRLRKQGLLKAVELFGLRSILFSRADIEALVANLKPEATP